MCDKDVVYIVKRLKVLHTELEDILNMAIKELERIEQTETQTHDIRTNTHECVTCRHNDEPWYSEACDPCTRANSNYEPQTETEIAKAIVHKMIDNSVIADDAYPDLRQRMHKAVERLDEYYPSEDERKE